MRVVTAEVMARHLRAVAADPRIVTSGNHAVPWRLLELADQSWESYRLFVLNAAAGVPERAGVTLETPFVGAGMRRRESLAYYPCRLSLVPALAEFYEWIDANQQVVFRRTERANDPAVIARQPAMT